MPYPQGLENMFFGPIGGDFAVEQFNQANQANKLSNQKSLQDIMFAQQDQPFKNQLLQSQARNTNALADQTELGNQFTRETWDSKTKAAVSKFLQEVDDNQLKSTMNKLERDMMSPDPQVRSEAQGLYGLTKEMVRMREEQKNKMDVEKLRSGTTIKAAEIAATSRENVARTKGPAGGGKGFDPKNPMHLYARYAEQARLAGTDEEAEHFTRLANEQWSKAIELEVAKARARAEGDPDISRLNNGDIPTREAPRPTPFNNPRKQSGTVGEGVTKNPAAQPMTMQQLQQMYPGVPPDKLREAFKRKFGIDVQ